MAITQVDTGGTLRPDNQPIGTLNDYSQYSMSGRVYTSGPDAVFKPRVLSSFLQARTEMSSNFEQEITTLRSRLAQFGMPESQINAMVMKARTQYSSTYGKLLASEANALEAIKQAKKQAKSSFLQGIFGALLGAALPVPQSKYQDVMSQYVTKAMNSQFPDVNIEVPGFNSGDE